MPITFNEKDNILYIYMDGKLIEEIDKNANGLNCYEWNFNSDKKILSHIGKLSPSEIPNNIYITSFIELEDACYDISISIHKEKTLDITFNIEISYAKWRNPFTVSSLVENLKKNLLADNKSIKIEEYASETHYDVYVTFTVPNDLAIKNIITNEYLYNISDIFAQTENELIKNTSDHLISKVFNFPKEYRTICSQYILWFGELLQELGIKSEISTENKNGKTFLTITSSEHSDLKSDIEKLLYMYLSLPYSEYLPAETTNKDIEKKISYQILQAQIENFKQQVELKTSIIELKALTNQKLQEELTQVKEKLLLLESMEESKITTLGGALTIGDYTIGPVKVNPKKFLAFLKKRKKV